jgi:hypothetical protein
MNLREDHRLAREKGEEVLTRHPSGSVYVMSLFNRDKTTVFGTVTEVTVQQAGKLLHEGTHREATPEEIEAFHQKNQAAKELILRGNASRYPKPFSLKVEQRR